MALAPVREGSAVEMHGGEMIGVGHEWLPAVTFVGRRSDCQACAKAGRPAVLGSRPEGLRSARTSTNQHPGYPAPMSCVTRLPVLPSRSLGTGCTLVAPCK